MLLRPLRLLLFLRWMVLLLVVVVYRQSERASEQQYTQLAQSIEAGCSSDARLAPSENREKALIS